VSLRRLDELRKRIERLTSCEVSPLLLLLRTGSDTKRLTEETMTGGLRSRTRRARTRGNPRPHRRSSLREGVDSHRVDDYGGEGTELLSRTLHSERDTGSGVVLNGEVGRSDAGSASLRTATDGNACEGNRVNTVKLEVRKSEETHPSPSNTSS
jgi:hypothetical protein